MQEVTFNVETITPLFLAGADQGTAELRAPSFRGAMRYWFRALVGGMVGTDAQGLKEVIEKESDVFGATDQGSSVRVKVSEASRGPEPFTERTNIQVRGEWKATGKGYLLWSMKLKKPSRYYFIPRTQFDVHISTNGTDIARHKQSVAAFWLLTSLGGIGSRSRRCAGSLAVKDVHGETYDFPFDMPTSASALKKQLEKGIANARSLCNVKPSSNLEAQFDALHPKACRIWILQDKTAWQNYENAMETIGASLQDYRNIIPRNRRKVFGLPLKGEVGYVERQASPLLLRLTKLQDNKYIGIAVLFKTKSADFPMQDYGIIENWISTKFPNALEVLL